MNKTEKQQTKGIYKSLAAFSQECPVILKETKGYGYNYADLPTIFKVINPLLKKHKLGITQLMDEGCIKTILFHIETGQTITSNTPIPMDVSLKGMNDYQVLGSAVTYIRRYALSSMLAIVTDKDTDAAGEQLPKKQKKTITNNRFETGVEKVANGEITKEAFLRMLQEFELSDIQVQALKLL
jgi:hypothetical protein|tara:strand:- start:13738 stop:14286 length:549 start_codon:yes stop_codon:yes gene_type:complete